MEVQDHAYLKDLLYGHVEITGDVTNSCESDKCDGEHFYKIQMLAPTGTHEMKTALMQI